jgi:hypothetical protein
MHVESSKNEAALKYLNALCNVEFILGVLYVLLMLECVHALIKVVPSKDVFVYDF